MDKYRTVKSRVMADALVWIGFEYRKDTNGNYLFVRNVDFDNAWKDLHSLRSIYYKKGEPTIELKREISKPEKVAPPVKIYTMDAWDKLIEVSDKLDGRQIFCIVNGRCINSDMTYEEASLLAQGKPTEDLEKECSLSERHILRLKPEEYFENVYSLTNYYKKKGNSILQKDKWLLWGDIVHNRLLTLDTYTLDCILELINLSDIENRRTPEVLWKLETQNHSNGILYLIKTTLITLSIRGNELLTVFKSKGDTQWNIKI